MGFFAHASGTDGPRDTTASAAATPEREQLGAIKGGIGQSSESAMARSSSPSETVTRPSAAMQAAQASSTRFLMPGDAAPR